MKGSEVDNILERLLSVRGNKPGKTVDLKEEEIKMLIDKSLIIIKEQKMLVELEAPLRVCGDIHGQYYDLLRIFEHCGYPGDNNFLFLGDYVDRGKQSLETICLLLAYKIKYPNKVYLLRGNHESRATNQQYGFHLECLKKYNQSITVWLYINEMFNYLPLAAVIDNKLFCIHGGLSPLLQSVEDIKNLERCRDIPTEGVMADLVWSDPDVGVEGFKLSERGAGFIFGENVIDKFLHVNKFESIIRAHQLCMDGYSILFGGKIITVWSAPKYCGRFDNCASIMEVDENLEKYFNIFEDAESSSNLQNDEKKKETQYFNPAMEKYFQ
jgi:serine/threonine-protein phosphatase PP1 catalytic subunit